MKRVLTISSYETFSALKEILAKLPVQQTLFELTHMSFPSDANRFLGTWDLVIFDAEQVMEERSGRVPVDWAKFLSGIRGPVLFVSPQRSLETVDEAFRLGANDYVAKPFPVRELLLRVNALLERRQRIVCVGGGTGLFTLLTGLKNLSGVQLISIVNMSDSGGSSGRLRMNFGILPPGDIRRSLVALSNAPELMNRVLQYRFERGEELKGHNFGNLFLTALSEITGSMPEAVRALSDILNIQGIVIPASCDSTNLVAEFEDGSVATEEKAISLCEGRDPSLRISKFYHTPKASCNPDAYAAILFAHHILIGPGDLYTSVVTNLVIEGFAKALQRSKAKKTYIVNVMTKPGETTGYSVEEHVKVIQQYLGGDYIDHILISTSPVSADRMEEYRGLGQEPVTVREPEVLRTMTKAGLVTADLASGSILVRHDPEKLRREIRKIIMGHQLPETA
ncbi:MAG: Gluconeogenesis factor [Candidatus Omnitrophica bacterium ADurb.Bin292]|nr:MAG: Gluconeogenesis factor [Candidatus Omnitrophica bacterium ADurb.Bin292]